MMEYEGDTEFEELAIRQEMMLPARYSAVVLPPRVAVMTGQGDGHHAGSMLVVECEDTDGTHLSMRQPIRHG